MKGNATPDQEISGFANQEQGRENSLALEPIGLLAENAPGAAPGATEVAGLGRRAVSGVLITTACAVVWEVAGGLATLVTARFLRPEDYAHFAVPFFAFGIGGAPVAFALDPRLVQASGCS